MQLAVVTCFLNEERYLGTFLRSLELQQRQPDRLLLVDDGSTDASGSIAAEFAARHDHARFLSRPSRQPERDRLAKAPELAAFCWGVEQLDITWDVVAKLDADLELTADCFAELERRLEADPKLGLAGPYLSIAARGGERERCPPGHVRGSTKFYRRQCFADVYPIPIRIGWDTSDEVVARMHGWRTESFSMPLGDSIHLRPTATQDGLLRGRRRDGTAAYAYGAGPGWVLVGTARRCVERPRLLGGLNFLLGWSIAALRRDPRADRRQRAFLRAEHRGRLRSALWRRLRLRRSRAGTRSPA
jgi:biofilm PGA synthesis N-glycosyltransferase PgaC